MYSYQKSASYNKMNMPRNSLELLIQKLVLTRTFAADQRDQVDALF